MTDVVGVGVTGKPFIFAVGADLKGVPVPRDREQALAIGGLATRCSGGSATLGVPTFAFVNGAAMGGGLEVALHCTYRTISSGVPALALPEVFLGLVPGWGGTQLLPNLIGAGQGRHGDHREPAQPEQDAQGPAGLRARASPTRSSSRPTSSSSRCVWAGAVLRGEIAVDRPEIDRGDGWDAAVARGRAIADTQGARRGTRAVPGARPDRAGPDGVLRRGLRRRGRGARRPDHERGAARRPLRLRPGAEARQAAGRRARQGPGPRRSPRSASSAPA